MKVEILRNSFCLILPSEWYENFPVTALEGFMAARNRWLHLGMGGLPYIVEEGKSGLLFEAGQAGRVSGDESSTWPIIRKKPYEWVTAVAG